MTLLYVDVTIIASKILTVNEVGFGLNKRGNIVMSESKKIENLRLSNEESNRITKTSIETALMLLMKKQTFHEISITDIVKRAGVSRTAYYRNYDSKEDILQCVMEDIVEEIMNAMILRLPIENTYKYWHRLFITVSQHAESFQIFLKANFKDAILNEIYKKILNYEPTDNVQTNYKSHFWSSAIYSVLAVWIREGMQQTAEEMANICCQIIDDMGNCPTK